MSIKLGHNVKSGLETLCFPEDLSMAEKRQSDLLESHCKGSIFISARVLKKMARGKRVRYG